MSGRRTERTVRRWPLEWLLECGRNKKRAEINTGGPRQGRNDPPAKASPRRKKKVDKHSGRRTHQAKNTLGETNTRRKNTLGEKHNGRSTPGDDNTGPNKLGEQKPGEKSWVKNIGRKKHGRKHQLYYTNTKLLYFYTAVKYCCKAVLYRYRAVLDCVIFIILPYTALHCIILYYTILYSAVVYCMILYYIALYCITLYYIVLYIVRLPVSHWVSICSTNFLFILDFLAHPHREASAFYFDFVCCFVLFVVRLSARFQSISS